MDVFGSQDTEVYLLHSLSSFHWCVSVSVSSGCT